MVSGMLLGCCSTWTHHFFLPSKWNYLHNFFIWNIFCNNGIWDEILLRLKCIIVPLPGLIGLSCWCKINLSLSTAYELVFSALCSRSTVKSKWNFKKHTYFVHSAERSLSTSSSERIMTLFDYFANSSVWWLHFSFLFFKEKASEESLQSRSFRSCRNWSIISLNNRKTFENFYKL